MSAAAPTRLGARTDLALLGLLALAFVTGWLAFGLGTPPARWSLVLHATGGVAVLLLLPWKSIIAWRRTGVGHQWTPPGCTSARVEGTRAGAVAVDGMLIDQASRNRGGDGHPGRSEHCLNCSKGDTSARGSLEPSFDGLYPSSRKAMAPVAVCSEAAETTSALVPLIGTASRIVLTSGRPLKLLQSTTTSPNLGLGLPV